ncbi:FG-GAP repeat domain-containing protein [Microbacterium sp.]|uniref:FG-GAP repeat domain-containing protein n=1 Tax=Microbacterium sp. TaxID=51671 RepID=UPI0037C74FE0
MGRRALALLAALAVAIGGVIATTPPPVHAAETFDPGNIIDDSLFYDGAAMTAAQIQSFLDEKVGTCRSSDCINILRASVSSRPARISDTTGNLVCNAFTGGTNLRISEIIYRAQVACGISAKVILVTLQKEQGLVTSKDPSDWNLNYAMGQACPDTAPCDPAYMGIGVQIISGATQLKTYKAANFARQPGVHDIRYSPTTSCGTKRVTIQNYATAALYNYTPYTPNDAALRNLYGLGDSCSSYGNRNFWRDYTDWFGSTRSSAVTSVDSVAHLLALDSAGELWAYPSNGRSGWLPRVSLGASWGSTTRIVAPGDLDGDGHRDLITVGAGGTALHRGDGALGYHAPVDLQRDWSGARLMSAAGDASGDGIPDVFTTDGSGNLLLWRGTGGSAFRDAIQVGQRWSGIDMIAGSADLSGDGKPDLLARHRDGSLLLYRGNGRGGWAGSARIGQGWSAMTGIHTPGDVTGDGRPDVLAVHSNGGLWLYPGKAGGTLGGGTRIGNGWQSLAAVVGPGPAATGLRPFAPGAGDVDGDAHRDLLAQTSAGALRLYRGNGAGGFAGSALVQESTPEGARYLTMGDFDGDGVADLGMIDASGFLHLQSGDGAGGYAAPTRIGNGWAGITAVVGGIDFDGDRRVDLIGRNASGDLMLYRGNGKGGFAESGVPIGRGWAGMTAILAVGDFDGDRLPDILARSSAGALLLYPTNGMGGWKSSSQIGVNWGALTAIAGTGDFSGDGNADVVARSSSGALLLYRGNGRGGWSGSATIGQNWNSITWLG